MSNPFNNITSPTLTSVNKMFNTIQRYIFSIIILSFSSLCVIQSTRAELISTVSIGNKINVVIEKTGEIILKENQLYTQPWQLSQHRGQPVLFMIIKASPKAKHLNKAFEQYFSQKNIDPNKYASIRLVVSNHLPSFFRGSVLSSLKKSKVQTPELTFVLDNKGLTWKHLQIEPLLSRVFILDADGKIHFHQAGKIESDKAELLVNILTNLIK